MSLVHKEHASVVAAVFVNSAKAISQFFSPFNQSDEKDYFLPRSICEKISHRYDGWGEGKDVHHARQGSQPAGVGGHRDRLAAHRRGHRARRLHVLRQVQFRLPRSLLGFKYAGEARRIGMASLRHGRGVHRRQHLCCILHVLGRAHDEEGGAGRETAEEGGLPPDRAPDSDHFGHDIHVDPTGPTEEQPQRGTDEGSVQVH